MESVVLTNFLKRTAKRPNFFCNRRILFDSIERQYEREQDTGYKSYVRSFYIRIPTEYETIKIWCGRGMFLDIFEPVKTNCHQFGLFEGKFLACTSGVSVQVWNLETLEEIINGDKQAHLEYNKDTETYRLIK